MCSVYYFTYSHHMDPDCLVKLGIAIKDTLSVILPHYKLVFNVLEDEWFRFENRGIANIVPLKESEVEGVLYTIDDTNLTVLDKDCGVPDLKYYRKQVRVWCRDGSRRLAYCYAAWPDMTSKGLLPSWDYLNTLIDAASKNKISPPFREWLQSHPTAY